MAFFVASSSPQRKRPASPQLPASLAQYQPRTKRLREQTKVLDEEPAGPPRVLRLKSSSTGASPLRQQQPFDTVPKTPEAVAETLGFNFFLQPAVVKALVCYFMTERRVLHEVSAGHTQTLLDMIEDGVEKLATVFLQRPVDFELYGQGHVLTTPDLPPHPLIVYHWAGPAFGFTDEFLLRTCGFDLVGAGLGRLSESCDDYWSNVVQAEMVGDFQASGFRFMDAFARSYFAPLWIGHMVSLSLEKVLVKLPEEMTQTDGVTVLQAMGRGLRRAPRPPYLSPLQRQLLQLWTTLLLEATDFDAVRQQAKWLAENMDIMALALYDGVRRGAPYEQLEAELGAQLICKKE